MRSDHDCLKLAAKHLESRFPASAMTQDEFFHEAERLADRIQRLIEDRLEILGDDLELKRDRSVTTPTD